MNNISVFANCVNPIFTKKGEMFPCGQCPLCRRKKMLEWTLRGQHELSTFNNKAIFLTLTYKPRFLPKKGYLERKIIRNGPADAGGNLRPEDMVLFNKRLRKYIKKNLDDRKIKIMYCGEYGTLRNRPHYHSIIFGINPEEIDEKTYKKIWKKGKVVLSESVATEKSIQYTVGYVSKKILNTETLEKDYRQKGRIPPFLRVSKGIGKRWALEHIDDWTKTLSITKDKTELPVPRYYIKTVKKMEGRTTKFEVEYKDYERNDITTEKEYRYKTYTNPYGKYTNKIYTTLMNKKAERLMRRRDDVNNEYYFENIKEEERDLKEFLDNWKKQFNIWNNIKNLSDYKLAKLNKIKHDKEIWIKKRIHKKKQKNKYKGCLSEENINMLKENAKLKVQNMMDSPFGKRQKMEILQEMLGEKI